MGSIWVFSRTRLPSVAIVGETGHSGACTGIMPAYSPWQRCHGRPADDLTEGGGCYRRARFRHGALSLAATADVGAAPGAIPVCQPPHHHIHQKKRPPPCQPQLCHERSSRAWRACGVTVLGGGSQSLVSGVKVEVAGNADTRRESHILRSASTGRRDIRRDVLDGGCHASSEISASCWQ